MKQRRVDRRKAGAHSRGIPFICKSTTRERLAPLAYGRFVNMALRLLAVATLVSGTALARWQPVEPPSSSKSLDGSHTDYPATGIAAVKPDSETPPNPDDCIGWNADLLNSGNPPFPSIDHPSWCSGMPNPNNTQLTGYTVGSCGRVYKGVPFLNVELAFGITPSDYGPRTLDPVLSSYPMLTRQTPHYLRATPYMERPTFGQVDLITGVPLVQETDFELPFGSAVFRHTRTYSEMPGNARGEFDTKFTNYLTCSNVGDLGSDPRAHFWDWAGQGWMMGEAPLFLVDAAYFNVAGEWTNNDGESAWSGHTTCYFVPDAHHAIPFRFVKGTDGIGRYEAPARFDAILEQVGGVLDQTKSTDKHPVWSVRPSKYHLWLQGQSVRYTIIPLWQQDVGPILEDASHVGFHEPPTDVEDLLVGVPDGNWGHDIDSINNNGPRRRLGTPYLGLVSEIADKFGSRIVMTYGPFEQSAIDNPHYADCVNCMQNCSAKGQLRRVQLFSNWSMDQAFNTNDVRLHWTLLYTHREISRKVGFGLSGDIQGEAMIPVVNALHSIHVYRNTTEGFAKPTSASSPHADAFLDRHASGDLRRQFVLPQAAFTPSGWERRTNQDCQNPQYDTSFPGTQSLPCTWNDMTVEDKRSALRSGLRELADRSVVTMTPQQRAAWGWHGGNLPADWHIEVTHLYDDGTLFFETDDGPNDCNAIYPPCEQPDPLWRRINRDADDGDGDCGDLQVAPRLLAVRSKTRSEVNPNQIASDTTTLYRYDTHDFLGSSYSASLEDTLQAPYLDSVMLRSILRQRTIDAIGASMLAEGTHAEWRDGSWPYCLLAMDDMSRVWLDRRLQPIDSADPSNTPNDFASLADVILLRVQPNLKQRMTGPYFAELFSDSSNANPRGFITPSDSAYMADGVSAYIERIGDRDLAGRIYRFIRPSTLTGGTSTSRWLVGEGHVADVTTVGANNEPPSRTQTCVLRRGLYHHPFPLHLGYQEVPASVNEISTMYGTAGMNFWNTVIDQYETAEALLQQDFVTSLDAQIGQSSGDTWTVPTTRRGLAMNPQGHTLYEQTWDFKKNGTFAVKGAREEFERDGEGRITAHKSIGWGSAANENQSTTNGLVSGFEYLTVGQPIGSGPSSSVTTHTWVQSGDAATNQKLSLTRSFYLSDGSAQWQSPTHTIAYLRDDFDASAHASNTPLLQDMAAEAMREGGPRWRMTRTYYKFDRTGTSVEDLKKRRIVRKTTIQPPTLNQSGVSEFPFEVEWYNDNGNMNWKATGSFTLNGALDLDLDGAMTSVSVQNRVFDYTEYDGWGRVIGTSIDSLAGSGVRLTWGYGLPGGPCSTDIKITAYEDGLSRIWNGPDSGSQSVPDDGDAFHYGTRYSHSEYGPDKIWYPNGRRDIVVETIEDAPSGGTGWNIQLIRRRTFKDVIKSDCNEDSGYYSLGPGTEEVLFGDRTLKEGFQVRWPGTFYGTAWGTVNSDPNGAGGDQVHRIAKIDAQTDAAGRPTKITITGEGTGGSITAEASYGIFGEVTRKVDPDGGITRTVTNDFGGVERTYRGTKDVHPYWGNSSTAVNGADDMVLVEKNYYGQSVNDCRQVIGTRRFRSIPNNQYSHTSLGLTDEDESGYLEEFHYDWRMRRVLSIKRDFDALGGAAKLITFTYLDHAGRTRVIATFAGSSATQVLSSAALNPALFTPGSTGQGSTPIPSPADLVAAGALRVSESIYNARGSVVEQRDYDTGDTSSAPGFLSTITEYDWKDRAVRVRTPNGLEETSEYDALGRRTRHSLWGNGKELQRTLSTFDTDGNATRVEVWERLPEATTNELGVVNNLANYVRSVTLNWYDVKNRLIATVDLGTIIAAQGPGNDGKYFNKFPDAQVPSCSIDISDLLPERTTDLFGKLQACYGTLGAIVRAYEYDLNGRQTRIYNPNGSITENIYDDLGQLVDVSDYAPAIGSQEPERIRRTRYNYQDGKMIGVASVAPTYGGAVNFSSSSDSFQSTQILLSADIVNDNFEYISTHTGLIAAVIFPYTGTPPIIPGDLRFQYFPDGMLATRMDYRGVKFKYTYDALGRLAETNVEYPFAQAQGAAPDRVDRVIYQYDPLGQLTNCTAYGKDNSDPPQTVVVADVKCSYDARGNLLTEWQAHGALVAQTGSTPSPRIDYAWSYSPAATFSGSGGKFNHDRLTSIKYPRKLPAAEASRRMISLDYGSAGSIDSGAHRVIAITDHLIGRLAGYTYAGTSRRAAITSGPLNSVVSAMSYDDPATNDAGLDHLDFLGRPLVRTFRDPTSPVNVGGDIQRSDMYAYNSAGERIADWVTQQLMGAPGQINDNTRSARFQYDALSRLVDFGSGTLIPGSGSTFMVDPDEDYVTQAWALDHLGNWLGGADPLLTPGVRTRVKEASSVTTTDQTHGVRVDNALTAITKVDSSGATTVGIVIDRAGNLIADQSYYYQYDGWNRVVQINERDSLTFNSNGDINGGVIGRLVAHYSYDGLGRLVRRQAPFYDSAEETIPTNFRSEHYYYDGVRRIQEVYVDPIAVTGPQGQQLLDPTGEAVSTGQEGGETGGDPLTGEQGASGSNATVTVFPGYVEREYVWGPESNGGYVDELVAQIAPIRVDHFGPGTWPISGPNKGGEPYYVIQDPVNFDVLAILDEDGEVVEQYSWEPYGTVLVCETHGSRPPPLNKVGHHGLFFDRLDMPAVIGGYMNYPTFESGAFLLGHVRNRAYMPSIGRWLQRDPNASGQVLAQMGREFDPSDPLGVDLGKLYGDGANLYQYVESMPGTSVDPTGLFEFSIIGLLGTSTNLADMQTDWAENVFDAGEEIAESGVGLAQSAAITQQFDVEWATDWSASDNDYSGSAYQARSYKTAMAKGRAAARASGGGFAVAGALSDGVNAIFAASKQHGSPLHYAHMKLEAFRFIKRNGFTLSDVDIKINKSIRATNGMGVRVGGKNIRPDVQILSKKGKLLCVIEIADSQTGTKLTQKIDNIKSTLDELGRPATVVGKKIRKRR